MLMHPMTGDRKDVVIKNAMDFISDCVWFDDETRKKIFDMVFGTKKGAVRYI